LGIGAKLGNISVSGLQRFDKLSASKLSASKLSASKQAQRNSAA
jgi:hypothetical protein